MSKSFKNTQTFKNLATFYFKAESVKLGGKDSLLFGRKKVTRTSLTKILMDEQKLIESSIGRGETANLLEAIDTEFKYGNVDKLIFGKLSDTLFDAFYTKLSKDSKEKILGEASTLLSKTYISVIPITDIRYNTKMLYNTEANKCQPLSSPDAYKEWLFLQEGKVKETRNKAHVFCSIEFDPKKDGGQREENIDGENISVVNSHLMPEWRKTPIKDAVLPEIFKELMDFIFPEARSLRYVQFWAYNMITDRNYVHLLLHSKRGIGKNTLLEIFSRLIGVENYYIIPTTFWDSPFDSELRHRRLIFLDEHKVDATRNLTQLKEYGNESRTYHAKGVANGDNEKIYASHIIANNLEVVNHLDSGARRFSVPIMGARNLTDAWGEEKVTRLHDLIKGDKDFIANIGHWILQNGNTSEFDKHTAFKTDLFHKIVFNGLYPWKQFVVETIKSRAEEKYLFSSMEEKLNTGRKKVGRTALYDFLTEHKDENGKYYGSLKQDSVTGERYIEPSESYMPTDMKPVEEIDYSKEEY